MLRRKMDLLVYITRLGLLLLFFISFLLMICWIYRYPIFFLVFVILILFCIRMFEFIEEGGE